jgi:hypothetical protein
MTTLDKSEAPATAEPDTDGQLGSEATDHSSEEHSESAKRSRWAEYAAAHPDSKRARAWRTLHDLEERAIELPFIGRFHTPDQHDVVYIAALAGLLVVGAVELPIAILVLGGHVLVKQHSSRSLSAIGEALEDVWGP